MYYYENFIERYLVYEIPLTNFLSQVFNVTVRKISRHFFEKKISAKFFGPRSGGGSGSGGGREGVGGEFTAAGTFMQTDFGSQETYDSVVL
jgi:hypothetical protein